MDISIPLRALSGKATGNRKLHNSILSSSTSTVKVGGFNWRDNNEFVVIVVVVVEEEWFVVVVMEEVLEEMFFPFKGKRLIGMCVSSSPLSVYDDFSWVEIKITMLRSMLTYVLFRRF